MEDDAVLEDDEEDEEDEEDAKERLRSSGRGRKARAAPPKRGSAAAAP